MLEPGERVAVAYSGGADSTCLLHLMQSAGYHAIAAHLHHGMRAEADEEMARCEEFANQLGLEFCGGKADVPALAQAAKVGLEEAGRIARYEFFGRVQRELGVRVATAHTLDDNAETILFNLARGAGTSGISGIPKARDGFLRPLLWARRAETRAYCGAHGLPFHDDPANSDHRNSRVAIRQIVVPALVAINSSAVQNISRLGEQAAAEAETLDAFAASMLETCELKSNHPLAFLANGLELTFDAEHLRHFMHPLVRRGMWLAAKHLGAQPEFEHCEALAEGIARSEKLSITFPESDIVAELSAGKLTFRRLMEAPRYRETLTIPGETISDEFGYAIECYPTEDPHGNDPRSLHVVISAESVKGNLYLRPFSAGDRLRPINTQTDKKVQDLLVDGGITGSMKLRYPIVCDMLGPVWLPGVALSERVRIEANTKSKLALVIKPLEGESV